MQRTVKRSLVTAGILGFLFPSISLLYVRREGLAVCIMALLLCSVLLLNFTDLAFFATSFLIFLLIQLFIWLVSLALGVWFAWRGVALQKLVQDKGLCWVLYVLLLLTFVSMLSSLPISFFRVQESFASIGISDIFIIQETNAQDYFQANNVVIFLDEKYEKNIGKVLATPHDVLSEREGHIFRNDEQTDIQMLLPTANNAFDFLNSTQSNTPSTVQLDSKHMPIHSWLVPENTLLIQYSDAELALLPLERVKGKALYVLFSMDFGKIGESLTSIIIP